MYMAFDIASAEASRLLAYFRGGSLLINAERVKACNKFEVLMTSVQRLNLSEYLITEKRKTSNKESLQTEKHISDDPLTMYESRSPSSPLSPSPKSPTPKGTFQPLPPLVPTKYKFVSSSLPSSASSSPRMSSAFMKNKGRNQNQISSPLRDSLARQHSVALTRLAQLREKHFQRSKSCEGRVSAPADDFDLWLTNVNNASHSSSQTSTPGTAESTKSYAHSTSGKDLYKSYDEQFKCGALCIFLPGFGKGKLVRARKEEPERECENPVFEPEPEPEPDMSHLISRRVSLEKFECGSWTSSAMINDQGGDNEFSNLYFDLPLELIRTGVNDDASSPVSSAFVFDKDLKGVLKNGSSKGAGKSGESSRHVRFSSSSPTAYPTSPSYTPRTLKAREEFSAFIDAQSA